MAVSVNFLPEESSTQVSGTSFHPNVIKTGMFNNFLGIFENDCNRYSSSLCTRLFGFSYHNLFLLHWLAPNFYGAEIHWFLVLVMLVQIFFRLDMEKLKCFI